MHAHNVASFIILLYVSACKYERTCTHTHVHTNAHVSVHILVCHQKSKFWYSYFERNMQMRKLKAESGPNRAHVSLQEKLVMLAEHACWALLGNRHGTCDDGYLTRPL